MTPFQILMFAATLFFAYQIYRHVQTLDDREVPKNEAPPAPAPSASALVERADEAYARGEFENAKNDLREALEHDSANPEIMNKLAFLTAKTGDRIAAIELYRRSLEIDENDDMTHNAIASLYRVENDYERAQDHYRKALEIDDTYAQTYYNYANLLADRGEIEEARTMYKRALELQSDFPQARDALLMLGREG
jgi:tetratricopeptide (TPR) repeat protein